MLRLAHPYSSGRAFSASFLALVALASEGCVSNPRISDGAGGSGATDASGGKTEAGATADGGTDAQGGAANVGGASGGSFGSDNGGAATTGGQSGLPGEFTFVPWGICAPVPPPGVAITDDDMEGSGECAKKTFRAVLAEIEAKYPELAGAARVDEPPEIGGSKFVEPFLRPDGGFSLAFSLGSGDCPAGCIDWQWIYVETGANCEVSQVGAFSRTYEEANCQTREGSPLWGTPQPTAPWFVCGADNSARDISGRFEVPFVGRVVPCVKGGEPANSSTLSGMMVIEIKQDESDLSQGTVSFSSSALSSEWLEGRSLEATFARSRAVIQVQTDSSSGLCIEQNELNATLDFEGCERSVFHLFEVLDPDCDGDYCKGDVEIELDLSELGNEAE